MVSMRSMHYYACFPYEGEGEYTGPAHMRLWHAFAGILIRHYSQTFTIMSLSPKSQILYKLLLGPYKPNDIEGQRYGYGH